jgi:NAD+ diphosphatase
MIGCHSLASDDVITIDKTELDEARWFSREEVAYAMQAVAVGAEDGAFIAPPRHAVAHHLLRWWLDR